jgi:hypothetical protein
VIAAGLVRGDHIATIMNRITVSPDGCWVYGGYLNPATGYGQVGKHSTVHRVMWEHENGPIPSGLHIDHLCRVRACCKPAHLEPVTPRENTLRGPGSKATCKHGHPYTPENTLRQTTGRRYCRTCRLKRNRNRRKAAA